MSATQLLTFPEEIEMPLYFGLAKNLSFDSKLGVPSLFKGLELEPGYYVYGYGTLAGFTDEQGEVVMDKALDGAMGTITQPPYNKVFLSHNYQDVACGKIIYAKIADTSEGRKPLILAKINEDHSDFPTIWKSIQNGYLDAFSIGGKYGQVEKVFENGRMVAKIHSMTVREVSLTSYPANAKALVLGSFQKALAFTKNNEGTRMETDQASKPALKKDAAGAADPAPAPAGDASSTLTDQIQKALTALGSRMDAMEKTLSGLVNKEGTDAAKAVKKAEGEDDEEKKEEDKKDEMEKSVKPVSRDELSKMIGEELRKALSDKGAERASAAPGNSADAKHMKKTADAKAEAAKGTQGTPLLDHLRGITR